MKESINQKENINETFDVLNDIREVKASPFFSHKVLQSIKNEKEEKVTFSWFSPQLQLVSLAIIVNVNVFVIAYSFNNSSSGDTNDINSFALEYNLQSNEESFLN